MRRRSAGRAARFRRATASPSTSTSPSVARSERCISRKRLDFPAPEAPSSQVKEPRSRAKDRFLSAQAPVGAPAGAPVRAPPGAA
jgi:hypothetical protein